MLGNLDLRHTKSLNPLWAWIQWSSPGSQGLREPACQWEYETPGMWIQEDLGPLCAAPVPSPSEWKKGHLQGM